MMAALLLALALATTLLQVALSATLGPAAITVPLLPIALVASWATLRAPREAAPALALVALVLGVLSEERVGMYLLALLPTAALLVTPPPVTAAGRLARAPLLAGAGAWLYLAVLYVASGQARMLPLVAVDVAAAAVGTAALAAVLALACLPLRVPARSLFA